MRNVKMKQAAESCWRRTLSFYGEPFVFRLIVGLFLGSLLGAFGPLFNFMTASCYNQNRLVNLDSSEDLKINHTPTSHQDFPENKARNRGFAFVGMLSTDSLIRTRGLSAAETWAQDMARIIDPKTGARSHTAKLGIFADTSFQTPGTGVEIIRLPGVADNVYPPQKKSFSMLKYMADHYIDQYEWFVRFDDDAYQGTAQVQVNL